VAQQPIELILLKQVASYLALPIFIVNPDGDLLFYNEPAEHILGCRYDERGEMPLDVWSVLFTPQTERGDPMPPEELPLVVTLSERRPVHGGFHIVGLDGARRHLSVTAIPIIGLGERFLGAVALFWEAEPT
jgi:PAS domain-containing protein